MAFGRGTFGGSKDAPFGRGLREAAETTVEAVLGVSARDRVLVVTNPDPEVAPIAWSVHDAAVQRGAETVLVSQPAKGEQDMADPTVLRALETDPDVIVVLTSGMLGADPERIHRPIHGTYTHYLQYLVGAGRSGAVRAPGVTRRLFTKALTVDHGKLAAECQEALDRLAETVELRVQGPGGTDLVVPVDATRAGSETGRYLEPGQGGALPAGEVRVPTLADAEASGTLAVDALLGIPGATIQPKAPVVCSVEAGKLTEITGGDDANQLRQALAEGSRSADRAVAGGWLTRDQAAVYAANTRRVAEVGFGLNPAAKPAGALPIDQVARGMVRVGIGAARDEMPPGAPVTIDALVRKATVTAVLDDGVELALVQQGRWLPAPTKVVA